MRVVVLANGVQELKASMATWLLAWRAARRGLPVTLAGIDGLSWGSGSMIVHGPQVHAGEESGSSLAETKRGAETAIELGPGDLLFLRTNPARDPARADLHRAAFGLARMAGDLGVTVLNDPDAIERAGSKLYLHELPLSIRPRQLVTSRWDDLRAFASAEAGPVVLKPLWGTRGDGVVKVDEGDEEGLRSAAETLFTDGPVVAQEYLHAAPQGDTRILMLEGEVITIDGKRAGVRRVPQPGEFRSNVHLGASPAPAVWSEKLLGVVREVGPYLRRTGIFLAGIDVVGEHIVEVNSYAPGGFMNAESQEGVDFLGAVVDAALARVS